MIKQQQLIVSKENGDCLRACLASILELPNDDRLPNCEDNADWVFAWEDFLKPFGLLLEYNQKRIWRNGYWVAGVPSLNFGPSISHAIVMFGDIVAFDPSPKQCYEIGRNLLGLKLVHGGHYLVVSDPSKLHKLEEYRKEAMTK